MNDIKERDIMFIYCQGRFYFGNLSFALPNNVAVKTANSDIIVNGFKLYALDGSFEIQICCSNSSRNSYNEIEKILSNEECYQLVENIEAICFGGLNGYKFAYNDEKTLNEEYIFDVNNGGKYDILDIVVSISKLNIFFDDNCKAEIVHELLNGLKRE